MRRIIIPLALILSFCFLTFVQAQDPRERRRAFVQDLLKGLIESQIEKPRPNVQPRPQPRPGNPPVVVETSREMIEARQYLANWNRACAELIQEIRVHEYESPKLRPLLADALKVKANIELLTRKAQIYPRVDPLIDDFRIIDQDWRLLSYRLKASGALSQECSRYVDQIGQLDTQLCGLFDVQPQLNRRELLRLASQLSSDYNHLLNDVYFVCRGQRGGQKLMDQGRKLQTMMAQVTALLPRANYDSIVEGYQQCIGEWKKFSRKLHRFQDERLRRSVADIEATGNLINEQLWLPVDIDREYYGSLIGSVERDAGKIFDSITMTELLKLKSPGDALNCAREFQIACGGFSQTLASGAPIEEVERGFRSFWGRWQTVDSLFHELHIPRVDHKLSDIEAAIVALRETFGDAPMMDHGMMLQLTGSLYANFQQLNNEIHRRVVQPRYDRNFHEQMCGGADQLAQSVNLINQRVVQGRINHQYRLGKNEYEQLFSQWNQLKRSMGRCKQDDRMVFSAYRRQIEPLMVKLQVVFTD